MVRDRTHTDAFSGNADDVHPNVDPDACHPVEHTVTGLSVEVSEVNFANCIANWFPSGSVPTELTAGVVVPTYHFEFRYVAVATDGAVGAFGARLYEIVINGFADPCADRNFFGSSQSTV